MDLGARASFDRLEELESHFEGVDFPVELALPYRVGDFLAVRDRMDEVRDFVQGKKIQVLSVHAAQGNLVADDCDRWAEPAMRLADELGARSVTFPPNQVKTGRIGAQDVVRKHLAALQRKATALAAVETFGGRRRVFRPEEIVTAGLPMILDTAHLHHDEQILSLIRRYHRNIPAVHLSARGTGEHHLPIDAFCLQVVDLLSGLGWNGGIVLEYLPWHHYRVKDDLELLGRFLAGEKEIQIPPPDDRFKHDRSCWGFV